MPSQFEKRKAKTVKKSETVELPTTEEINYSATGHDIFYDNEKKMYMIVDIEYDINSGLARVKEVKPLADSQPVATYKIKEIFTKRIFNIK